MQAVNEKLPDEAYTLHVNDAGDGPGGRHLACNDRRRLRSDRVRTVKAGFCSFVWHRARYLPTCSRLPSPSHEWQDSCALASRNETFAANPNQALCGINYIA